MSVIQPYTTASNECGYCQRKKGSVTYGKCIYLALRAVRVCAADVVGCGELWCGGVALR